MNKGSFVNTLPLPLRTFVMDAQTAALGSESGLTFQRRPQPDISEGILRGAAYLKPHSGSRSSSQFRMDQNASNGSSSSSANSSMSGSTSSAQNYSDGNKQALLVDNLVTQQGIIFTIHDDIQLKLFDVDSTLSPEEFDKVAARLDRQSRIMLCEKVKLIYGFDSLTPFIVRLIRTLNFSQFFSIFDITSNIKLYGFYSLSYTNPVEILVKQIRNDLFIVKSFKVFTIQEMKKEHDFHLPYKEFKRMNLVHGNLVVVKILFKGEQKPIDLELIEPLLKDVERLHLSLESEAKLKPFTDLIDRQGKQLQYLKFGVNRGTFKNIPVRNPIDTMKLVNIDNLDFIDDLKGCSSLDVFFDNWELRKNCNIQFQPDFIIGFDVHQSIQSLRTLNIFHTYLRSRDLNKLKMFPRLVNSKISYVILNEDGFDMSECQQLQELKIHFTYDELTEDPVRDEEVVSRVFWPPNIKKLSVTVHNIKNLRQCFSVRMNILRKIAKPLPPSVDDLCIDISYDTGGSGPEAYSVSKDDIRGIADLVNKILTPNLKNLKLKGISRYNYKIGKPLVFSTIEFPPSLNLLSLNDFILDFSTMDLPHLKRLYFEHSLFDAKFQLPDADDITIEKCTLKDVEYLPARYNRIEYKMCTFRQSPSYDGDASKIVINNCRLMEERTSDIFRRARRKPVTIQSPTSFNRGQFDRNRSGSGSDSSYSRSFASLMDDASQGRGGRQSRSSQQRRQQQRQSMPSRPTDSLDTRQTVSPASSLQQASRMQDPQMHSFPRHMRNYTVPSLVSTDQPMQNLPQLQPQQQQQPQQMHYPMFASSSLSGLSNDHHVMGSLRSSPSVTSVNQMGSPRSAGPTFGGFDYMGNTGFAGFLDTDLQSRLNDMSLGPSNSNVASPYVSRQDQRVTSPPMNSFLMSPSTSSELHQQQQQQNHQNHQQQPQPQQTQQRIVRQSTSDVSLSGMMLPFPHTSLSSMNSMSSGGSGYAGMAQSFEGSAFVPSARSNFGFYMNQPQQVIQPGFGRPPLSLKTPVSGAPSNGESSRLMMSPDNASPYADTSPFPMGQSNSDRGRSTDTF